MRKNLISSLILVMTLSTFSMPVWAEDEIFVDNTMVGAAIMDSLTPDDAQKMASEDEINVPGE